MAMHAILCTIAITLLVLVIAHFASCFSVTFCVSSSEKVVFGSMCF